MFFIGQTIFKLVPDRVGKQTFLPCLRLEKAFGLDFYQHRVSGNKQWMNRFFQFSSLDTIHDLKGKPGE